MLQDSAMNRTRGRGVEGVGSRSLQENERVIVCQGLPRPLCDLCYELVVEGRELEDPQKLDYEQPKAED
jgi:hypothetical protein